MENEGTPIANQKKQKNKKTLNKSSPID